MAPTTPRDKMTDIAAKLAAHPGVVEHIHAVYDFVISGDGGGTWRMVLGPRPSLDETNAAAVLESPLPAHCTLRLGGPDLLALLEGRAQAPLLLLQGKLKIEGDLAQAMKLSALAELLRD